MKFEYVILIQEKALKLEQLERLLSEIPRRPMITRSQVKRRQSQSCKFWNIAKNSNFKILQQTLHATHLLKLLDRMCKYEMDPTRTVRTTERTWDAGQTDGRTEWNQYTPLQLRIMMSAKWQASCLDLNVIGKPLFKDSPCSNNITLV